MEDEEQYPSPQEDEFVSFPPRDRDERVRAYKYAPLPVVIFSFRSVQFGAALSAFAEVA